MRYNDEIILNSSFELVRYENIICEKTNSLIPLKGDSALVAKSCYREKLCVVAERACN